MSQFIKFYFTSVINMFRTLIHSSSGACDIFYCITTLLVSVWLVGMVSVWQASACHTDTTPTSHTETPTHIETRTHNVILCGDTIEKSQAPDDGCINVRNMLSTEEVK